MLSQRCPLCGLPMSFCDSADCDLGSHWICDGPNDGTRGEGCGKCVK